MGRVPLMTALADIRKNAATVNERPLSATLARVRP
jgi:hypothetical protein